MDPYGVLGVSANASEAELRAAYRRAVQREHPDHNGGSPEAARRFEAVQDAWAEIRRQRSRPGAEPPPAGTASPPTGDPGVDARLAAMEQELRAARAAQEQAEQAARERARRAREAAAAARAAGQDERPSDEELGYIRTDDSFGKIFADAREELLGGLKDKPVTERAADLLDEVAEALRDGRRKRS